MRWNKFFISICLLTMACQVMAKDSVEVASEPENRYNKYVQKAFDRWDMLIPRQFIVQNAGNMGALSAGIGWEYGHRGMWETHLLFGFIPRHESSRMKMTVTLKENFIPWSIDLKEGWSVQPLSASIYLNTVIGHEFWKSQPKRYPDDYYEFMSTKFRLNVGFGQQITWQIPYKKRRYARSISLFYEVSSCDLYIRSKIIDHSVPLKDIIGLSIGLKLQTL
ncbi:MAG: hypothetical protein K6E54_11305 [Bacteroidaceae bacterium]|nr:hypothetical protein [Bacteroidaceae bacterium]